LSKQISWHPAKPWFINRAPAHFRPWLSDAGSLTQRLIQASANRFRVQVLEQSWGKASLDELQVLQLKDASQAYIRHVHLICADETWVFARTVIPRDSLQGRLSILQHLGSKPLGQLLFSSPGLRRVGREVACIKPSHPLYNRATQDLSVKPHELWGRRSLFVLYAKPLLVNEIFLPATACFKARIRNWSK